MKPAYHIREMRQEDLEEVTALEAACFSRPWSYRDFEEALANPDRVYLAAVAEEPPGGVIGGCMLTRIADEGEITNVAVYKQYREQKIATSLLEALFRLGAERYGITAFTLEVRSRNAAAVGLYEKLGFTVAGVRRNFYDRPQDDALILWKI